MTETSNPSLKKVETLVEESGMITHFKTTSKFRKNGWEVLVSPFYHDSISDTVREADLVVEKQFNSDTNPFHSSVQVNVQLFVECKYIKHEIVFWFDAVDKDRAVQSIERETGLEIAIRRSADIEPGKFHYLKGNSAVKLFSANANKEDVIYKALNQCLHSQINFRKKGKNPIKKQFSDHQDARGYVVQYPVIVCEGFDKLQKVEFEEDGTFITKSLKDHFMIETNYRDDYFLVDVVDINYLETFLSSLGQEIQDIVSAHSFKTRLGR